MQPQLYSVGHINLLSLSLFLSLTLSSGGLRPLHAAASLGSSTGVEITKILLERGAELGSLTTSDVEPLEQGEEDENGKDGNITVDGWTPLHLACATGRELVGELFVRVCGSERRYHSV